jgi:hypothetical protein
MAVPALTHGELFVMRILTGLWLLLLAVGFVGAADPAPRYGVAADPKTYPQATPQETLASALKAVDDKRFDYLVAQLSDPAFVDDRVRRLHGGNFAAQVTDTQTRLDPSTVKLLGRFLKDGKWTVEGRQAVVRLDDVRDRAVLLKQIDGRWYLEHRNKPPEEAR